MAINIEIKARSSNQDAVREILKSRNADFKGVDHQIDTYFVVPNGRLKLREGNIENTLIYYEREDKEGPKQSNVDIYHCEPKPELKETLTSALGVLVVVDKKREIYFIDKIKFHVDVVEGLGNFIEIEAIDETGTMDKDILYKQCQEYLKLFNIAEEDLVSVSYSDLLLEK